MRNVPSLWSDFNSPLTSFHAWRPILREFDSFMNDALSGGSLERNAFFQPSLDVEEKDNGYVISVDVPGLEKDNIDIEMQGNKLVISGERVSGSQNTEGLTRVVERRYGRFQRTIALPEGIRADAVEADYRNGVLTIAVPKAEKSLNQKIKIGSQKNDGLLKKWLGSPDKTESVSGSEKIKMAN